MLTPQGLLRLMSLHLLKHSLFLIILVFITGNIWRRTRGCIFIFRFKVVSSNIPLLLSHPHTHITHSLCLQAHEQPRQSPKNLHHSQGVVAFHSSAPQASRAGTYSDVQAVVNRSLPAFHSCSKSIGLCRTQHLIEAHKVTDYWIVTYCIELVCGSVANEPP